MVTYTFVGSKGIALKMNIIRPFSQNSQFDIANFFNYHPGSSWRILSVYYLQGFKYFDTLSLLHKHAKIKTRGSAVIHNCRIREDFNSQSKKCLYLEFFSGPFSGIRTKYGEKLRIFSHSV